MTRPMGRPNITLSQIEVIVELSQSSHSTVSRATIAQQAGCSKQCVWLYQRKYGLL